MHRTARLAVVCAALLAAVSGTPSISPTSQNGYGPGLSPAIPPQPAPEPDESDVDFDAPSAPVLPSGPTVAGPDLRFGDDPLRLVVDEENVRRYSLGSDVYEVWLCHNPGVVMPFDVDYAVDVLSGAIADYFGWLSNGLYQPSFVAGGTVVVDDPAINGVNPYPCVPDVKAGSSGTANAAFIVVQEGSPLASGRTRMPPLCFSGCPTTFPANDRWVATGDGAFVIWSPFFAFPSLFTSAHEMGHSHHWPHSYSGFTDSEYDNPMDVMSGNSLPDGSKSLLPFATSAFNRYRAGWIDPDDVLIYTGGILEATLSPPDVAGTQMIVLPLTLGEGVFVALGARRNSLFDPIPPEWEGVDAYLVNQVCVGGYPCGGLSSYMGPYPAAPWEVVNVATVGSDFDFDWYFDLIAAGYARLQVLESNADGYVLRLIGFSDVFDTVFREDIFWLAASGITKGCGGTDFCPAGKVTRGQMAAFLVRALGLADSLDDPFWDDDGHLFEADIEKLAAAGITKGCNPPANDKFCPDAPVTRGAMAAFLVRALELTDSGDIEFIDDDDTVFEADIEKLAAAGITKGCNPPANDKFCPSVHVTREQMAAFLNRALG